MSPVNPIDVVARPAALAVSLRAHLGAVAWTRVLQVGALGAEQGADVCLVGGAVRDLLLGRPLQDLDLVVDGDALAVARALADAEGGTRTLHPAFGTAKWCAPDGVEVDLAGARAERYPSPAALPEVRPASLSDDLGRRDFSINAMAVSVHPERLGTLVDPHGGCSDLRAGLLRVLHGGSFVDDPTRGYRAARFASRFGFQLEAATRAQLDDALQEGAFDALGRERLGAEVDRLLGEAAVPRALQHLAEWGLLAPIAPALELDAARLSAVARVLDALERLSVGSDPATRPDARRALWVLLGSWVPHEQRAAAGRLVPGNRARQDAWRLGPDRVSSVIEALPASAGRASTGALLASLEPAELAALWGQAGEDPSIADALAWWARTGRRVVPAVDGRALLAEGVAPGPAVGRGLAAARAAAWEGASPSAQLAAALAAASA